MAELQAQLETQNSSTSEAAEARAALETELADLQTEVQEANTKIKQQIETLDLKAEENQVGEARQQPDCHL